MQRLDYKLLVVQVAAILVTYIMVNIPLASAATQVNIFASPTAPTAVRTAQYDVGELINFNAVIQQSFRGGKTKVLLNIDGADENSEVKKIYIYRCRDSDPSECSTFQPETFDTYVKTELPWDEGVLYEKQGVAYPQIANIMVLVLLEREGNPRWVSVWHRIVRDDFNSFNQFSFELPQINVYANSPDMVDAIETFITNTLMLPMNWISRVAFTGATGRYSIGSDAGQIESDNPEFQGVKSSGNELESINKDYYFVFPNTTSGIAIPFTLNRNPSFDCGDGECESELGETERTCCLDCDCTGGYYCDWSQTADTGSCQDAAGITLAAAASDLEVTECDDSVDGALRLTVANPPESLDSIDAIINLDGNPKPISCDGGPAIFDCAFSVTPTIRCGEGTYQITGGTLQAVLSFMDGDDEMTLVRNINVPPIDVNYDCGCDSDFYCDTGRNACRSKNFQLLVRPVEPYMSNYQQGDTMDFLVNITNPPSGMTVTDEYAHINLSEGSVYPGEITCTLPVVAADGSYGYECSMNFQISGYSPNNIYFFPREEYKNAMFFQIQYNDGSRSQTETLSAPFGPITIPSYKCGNSACDTGQGEAVGTCCEDCGCATTTEYCDWILGCQEHDNLQLTTSATTIELDDCEAGHAVYLDVYLANLDAGNVQPYGAALECQHYVGATISTVSYVEGCTQVGGSQSGLYNCTLIVNPIDNCENRVGFDSGSMVYRVGSTANPNSLRCTAAFDDMYYRSNGTIRESVQSSFGIIEINANYHCGDGTCEALLNEDNSNCCLDCACADNTYYCNWGPQLDPPYVCTPKANMALTILPAQTNFDSCEMENELDVQITVQNPATGLEVLQKSAKINGKKASISCEAPEEEETVEYTYSCKVKIKPEPDCRQHSTNACTRWNYGDCAGRESGYCVTFSNPQCSEVGEVIDLDPTVCPGLIPGEEGSECYDPHTCSCTESCTCLETGEIGYYQYLDNAINFTVKYYNGRTYTVGRIGGELGTIEVVQSGETLKDIMEDTINQLMDNLDKMMGILNDMQEMIQTCIDWMISAIIWSIIATIAVPLTIGTIGSFAGTDAGWKNFGKNMKSTSEIGGTVIDAIGKICDMFQKYYDIMIEQININNDMIKMQNCIRMFQHSMDIGLYKGNELSAFNDLKACMDMSGIKSSMSNIQSSLNGITNDAGDIADDIGDAADDIGEIIDNGEEDNTNLYVKWNGVKVPGVCQYAGQGNYDTVSGTPTTYACKYSMFTIHGSAEGCSGTVRALIDDSISWNLGQVIDIKTHGSVLGLTRFTNGESLHSLRLYCDEKPNDEDYTAGEKKYGKTVPLIIYQGTPLAVNTGQPKDGECDCKDKITNPQGQAESLGEKPTLKISNSAGTTVCETDTCTFPAGVLKLMIGVPANYKGCKLKMNGVQLAVTDESKTIDKDMTIGPYNVELQCIKKSDNTPGETKKVTLTVTAAQPDSTEITLTQSSITVTPAANSVNFKFNTGINTRVKYAVVESVGVITPTMTAFDPSTTQQANYDLTVPNLKVNTQYSYKIVAYKTETDKKEVTGTFTTTTTPTNQYALVNAPSSFVSLWGGITNTGVNTLVCRMGDKTKVLIVDKTDSVYKYENKPYWKVKLESINDYKAAADTLCTAANVNKEYYAWSGGLTLQ